VVSAATGGRAPPPPVSVQFDRLAEWSFRLAMASAARVNMIMSVRWQRPQGAPQGDPPEGGIRSSGRAQEPAYGLRCPALPWPAFGTVPD
jgi:hypothetical protein